MKTGGIPRPNITLGPIVKGQNTIVLIARRRQGYNVLRPHSSLSYRPPAPDAIQPVPTENMTLGLLIPNSMAKLILKMVQLLGAGQKYFL